MTFTIQLGTVTITVNPATAPDPVIAQPNSTAAVYATFQETAVESGLMGTIFHAFKSVTELNTHDKSVAPWPPRYGTNEAPWGQPANAETGDREVTLIDSDTIRRWTQAIKSTAQSRLSVLSHYKDLATAIASGIKSAMESKIKTGRVTLPVTGGVPGGQWITINTPISSDAEIFLQARGYEGSLRSASLIEIGSSGFTIWGDGVDEAYEVSWMVIG